MSGSHKFRKKPVVIEAIQWEGGLIDPIAEFFGRENDEKWDIDNGKVVIFTLEGEHRANVGDWIIRGVAGEFYPCKPDIFEQTYEAAS